MNSDQLYGRTINCSCGRTHRIEPREVIYSEDAVAALPIAAEKFGLGRVVAAVMDQRTREAAGEAVAKSLSQRGFRVKRVVVEDGPQGASPACDEATKRVVENRSHGVDWMVTIGGGVMNDLGKWIAGERDIPFLCFATAASMNGFASANVAPTLGGVKSLVRAKPPRAVLSAPQVLMDAPYRLTTAGLGDALAKSVSTADWRLNHLLFGDYYCAAAAALISEIEPLYLNHPLGVRSREPKAIEALFRALLMTGVSMTMAETSSPASGGEHLISHALDMKAGADGAEHDLHGRQVGIATVLASELYKRVLAVENPEFTSPSEIIAPAYWGDSGKSITGLYAEKIPRLLRMKTALSTGAAWDELRGELSPMVHPPEVIHQCLAAAGAAVKANDIGASREHLADIFSRAHEIRARVTILDLADILGLMPGAAYEMVEEWA